MKIAVAFDNVVALTQLAKERFARNLYGKEISWQVFSYATVVEGGVLTAEEYAEVCRCARLGAPGIRVVSWCNHYLSHLMRDHRFWIVTDRSIQDGTLKFAMDWMQDRGVGFPLMVVDKEKHSPNRFRSFDMFVDTDVERLRVLVGIVPHLIHFHWPFGEEKPEIPGVKRVESWIELNSHVCSLSTPELTGTPS